MTNSELLDKNGDGELKLCGKKSKLYILMSTLVDKKSKYEIKKSMFWVKELKSWGKKSKSCIQMSTLVYKMII